MGAVRDKMRVLVTYLCALWPGWRALGNGVAVAVAAAVVADVVTYVLGLELPRLHLLEIHDKQWCPPVCRRYLQDGLRWLWQHSRMYRAVIPILRDVVGGGGRVDIVDMCSGGGGPVALVADALQRDMRRGTRGGRGKEPEVHANLTDLYPNPSAWERVVHSAKCSHVRYQSQPVDATAFPPHLARRGVRTMFACFHHFQLELATSILADAARNRQPITVFEFTNRSFVAMLFYLFVGLGSPVLAVLMPPRCLAHFSLAPIMGVINTFDGIVSCLRTYSPTELLAMGRAAQESVGVSPTEYRWRAAKRWVWYYPVPLTYLIGEPI